MADDEREEDFTVLVVSGDEEFSNYECGILAAMECEYVLVASSAEAVEELEVSHYDLVVSDYILPDGDALSMLEKAERACFRNVPFIVTTMRGDEKTAVEVMKRGALDYLVKDASFLELMGPAVARAVKNVRAERLLQAAQSKLAEIERKFLIVSENVGDVIFMLDPARARLTYASASIRAVIGMRELDPTTIKPRRFMTRRAFADLVRIIDTKLREARMCSGPVAPELVRTEFVSAAGKVIKAEMSINVVEDKDGSYEILGVARDIGARLEDEERIRHSLEEKEVLLREIHHRVKNNLQIVSSMLSLQIMASDNKAVAEVLSESQNRIRTMAVIHEQLCESGDLTRISMRSYLERIIGGIVDMMNGRVAFESEIADLGMDMDEAVPCGLILNELILNAIKYGCKKDHPVIRVRFGEREGQKRLSVADEGEGFAPGFDPTRSGSLGFSLVATLASQLGGKISWRNREAPESGGVMEVAWAD